MQRTLAAKKKSSLQIIAEEDDVDESESVSHLPQETPAQTVENTESAMLMR